MKGPQRRLVCPRCGKGFFAWRPDDLPGARVKCYFCGNQFDDEASQRKPLEPPPPPPAAPAGDDSAPAKPEGDGS